MAGRKFPGVPRGATRAAPTSTPLVELPEIEVLESSDASPSVLLIGGSGTGKTFSIGKLLEAGLRGLILAIEPKLQTIARYKPSAIYIHAPVKSADGTHRPPTIDEKYHRLLAFGDALEKGKYRVDKDGVPFDFIAIDGLLEMGDLIYSYWKKKKPVSDSTGKQNTYGMWDEIADRSIDLFKRFQQAAGLVSKELGLVPIPLIATIGEQMIEGRSGEVKYVALYPGQKAPKNLPYNFECVIRLSTRSVGGVYEFVAHTVGSEEFFAKCPSGIFEPEEINPDFAVMFSKIMKAMRVVST